MKPIHILAVAVLTLGAPVVQRGALAQQCTGWDVASTTGPSARQNHMLSDDGIGVLLFGGFNNFNGVGFSGDTWRWDGEEWMELFPNAAPSLRANCDMAYDTKFKQVYLFGGFYNPGSSIYYDDTWAWDGKDWFQLITAGAPAPRSQHRMVYDEAREQVVLFGGFGAVRYNDTWVFDGSSWTQMFPATVPQGRNNHAMAYDPVREKVVMFGGFPGSGRLNDTWEWDGTDWTKILTPTLPPGRQYHDMEFDPQSGTIIMSCGQTATFTRYDDTWSYDGTDWTLVSVSAPTARDQHAMAYLASTNTLVMVGGYFGSGIVSPETLLLGCEGEACYPDCNKDGSLDFFDFLCFQNQFATGQSYADCNEDGSLDFFDFLCFQNQFAFGCP